MLRLLAACLLAASLLPGLALAQGGAEGAFAKLAADSYAETEVGIATLSASGAATAPMALEALSEGRLFFRPGDKAVFVKSKAGVVLDARTGAPAVEDVPNLKPVRLNNRVRRALEAA